MPSPQQPGDDESPQTPPRLRPRSLRVAGLDGPAAAVYKDDLRSRVWRVDTPAYGPVVVKQFVYRPARQRVSLVVGVHPGQLELARNLQLAAAGVPVVPILDAGVEAQGLGARAWLATLRVGESMQRLLQDRGDDAAATRALLDAAAALVRHLLSSGYTFKDLKPSNIVIADDGQAHLIDVGSARRDTTPKQVARMLGVMDRVLARDGVDEEDRLFFKERVNDG